MTLTFEQILDAVVERTTHQRYRFLCGDDSPDKNGWRTQVVDRYYRLTGNLEHAVHHLDPNAPPPVSCCAVPG